MEETSARDIESIVRGLAAAWRSLRLYPPTSPLPRQAAEQTASALRQVLGPEEGIVLSVTRDGLACGSATVPSGMPGVGDIADAFRRHGVAHVEFADGCEASEVVALLGVLSGDVDEVRGRGGVDHAVAAAGAPHVSVSEIVLNVVQAPAEEVSDGDVDAFLRELAAEPGKLGAWLQAALKGDPGALADGLAEIETAVGFVGVPGLVESLAAAFGQQDAAGKDAMIELAVGQGPAAGLVAQVFGKLGTTDIASSLMEGVFGTNMLSLSDALTRLPIDGRRETILDEVQRLLPAAGHSEKEAGFLRHMMGVRKRTEPEKPLVESVTDYAAAMAASEVPPDVLERARHEAAGISAMATEVRGIATMLSLLDQQSDLELYKRDLQMLASAVGRLVRRARLDVAARVLAELSAREARSTQPWPELPLLLRQARETATGGTTMRDLLEAVASDSSLVTAAKDVLRNAGDGAHRTLVREALHGRQPRLDVVEQIVGRRVVDFLASEARSLQWFQLAQVAGRLARESDARALEALEQLVRRPDEQSRQEVARGLAAAGGPVPLLGRLLSDESLAVAAAAARGLAKAGGSQAAAVLSARLTGLDLDGKDFELGREVMSALGQIDHKVSRDALQRIAGRRVLIRRSKYNEVQQLAKKALADLEEVETA